MTTKNFVVKNGITTGNITLDAGTGNITGTNLSVTGVSILGAVGNVKITGGTSGQAIVTDGLGNLSFANSSSISSPAPMPTYVAVGDTITISANYQGLFGYPITIDGTMTVDGVLVDVNDNGNGGGGGGTATALNATIANVIISGGTSGYYLQTDGAGVLSWAAGGGGGNGSPGGVNTQIQFNDEGLFGGNTGFTFNKTTGVFSAPSIVVTGNITPSANVTYSLGNNTNRFSDLYLAGNTINLGSATISANATAISFTNPQGGTFVVAGNSTNSDSNLGNIAIANYFVGSGNGLSNIQGANVSGAVTTAGSVTTAAQPNITSLGTLSSLSVSGISNLGSVSNVRITGGTVNYVLRTDGAGNLSWAAPNIPPNDQTSAYVLVASDAGKYINITTGGVTVPNSVFSSGDTLSIYNNSASNQSIIQAPDVTMYQVGTATTGNRTLVQRGLATLLCVGANTFVITGGGLT